MELLSDETKYYKLNAQRLRKRGSSTLSRQLYQMADIFRLIILALSWCILPISTLGVLLFDPPFEVGLGVVHRNGAV
jgi:hypothetical protein